MSIWKNLLSKLLAVSNPTFTISKAYNLHRFFFHMMKLITFTILKNTDWFPRVYYWKRSGFELWSRNSLVLNDTYFKFYLYSYWENSLSWVPTFCFPLRIDQNGDSSLLSYRNWILVGPFLPASAMALVVSYSSFWVSHHTQTAKARFMVLSV